MLQQASSSTETFPAASSRRQFRWADFVLPSTLQLSPLMEVLIEPVGCLLTSQRVELGLHEALVNAVRHGNAEDPSKRLRVRRITTPHWLVWQVQDEGSGLPPNARAASLPEQPEALSGRGLFLIHQCFDDVRWSRRGNRLQLACRRPLNDADSPGL
ncbi:ATP-binding protein [Synechococcus sp. A15-28]|uniref:ATP-binding protein n=1 Tax=Synechococcus sp. A15-28 TaxID=1050638 RepID=UPI0025703CDD|nr:ATP-binding protein [Synechococcus sp. A15-28]